VDELNGNADMFITSGHATERDWQIGYSYKNGALKSQNGSLYGVDTAGNKFQIKSAHPRVYLPVGNCLIGHIDNSNAMALAFLNSASVVQMIGYTVPTWFRFYGMGHS
jgi:zinc protease